MKRAVFFSLALLGTALLLASNQSPLALRVVLVATVNGVPDVLASGDHGAVRRWRLRASIQRTVERRPDLLSQRTWSPEESRLLAELREQLGGGPPETSAERTA